MNELTENAPPVERRRGARIEGAIRRNRAYGYVIAFLVLLLDQATKWVIVGPLDLMTRRQIEIASFLDLHFVDNHGVSTGVLTAESDAMRWLLVAVTTAIALFVGIWLYREKRRDDAMGLALVLGGALGNILDRVRLGYVVDFVDFHIGDFKPFLVFNLADAAITVGVLLLLLRALLTRTDKTPK